MKTNILAILFPLVAGFAAAQTEADLAVGTAAPDFSLPFATKDSMYRTPLNLSALIGKSAIILAFYPADWSAGCTKEVCTLRDSFSGLQDLNAEVLGVSGDYVWSHHELASGRSFRIRLEVIDSVFDPDDNRTYVQNRC